MTGITPNDYEETKVGTDTIMAPTTFGFYIVHRWVNGLINFSSILRVIV